ncbi:MAG TPA: TetR/AcrR family transcriptional regulator [Terriglobales bacterium]
MPRTADPHLQDRILKAALTLLRERGQKGLTLRSVARAAGTTTTTVYKRFRNRDALVAELADRAQQRLIADLTSVQSVEEIYRRHLHFAEKNPREYQLLFSGMGTETFGGRGDRAVETWILGQLAAQFGGKPEDYLDFHAVLFLATQGAASLITFAPSHRASAAVRERSIAVCDILVNHIEAFRQKPPAVE